MERKEYIEILVKLGIFDTEARIYMALLEKRELTALEIHELTNVPRSKVYEITQRMIHRGMCIEKQVGRRKKYQAVEPRRALNRLIKEYEDDLDEKKKLTKEFNKTVYSIYNQGMQIVDASEYVEIIKGLPSIHERYINLVKNTKKELLGFVKRPYACGHKRQKVGEQENAEFEILKRGVVARVLYELPGEEEIDFLTTHIKKCVEAGEKARVIEQVPIKMYIFDQRYVLMALENSKLVTSPLTMLVIEHPGLAKAARISFDYLWEKAHDYRVLRSLGRNKSKNEK